MAIEYVEPGSLVPAPYNPRAIDEAALKRLTALLETHGFVDPVIARREDRLLIGGHQRLKANALRKKPDAKVPCVFLEGVSDEHAKALNIALNNPGAQGQYQPDQLAELLAELDRTELNLPAATGFRRDDIDGMIAALDADALDDDVTIPEAFEVVVECDDEPHQRRLFERLTAEGLKCRLSML